MLVIGFLSMYQHARVYGRPRFFCRIALEKASSVCRTRYCKYCDANDALLAVWIIYQALFWKRLLFLLTNKYSTLYIYLHFCRGIVFHGSTCMPYCGKQREPPPNTSLHPVSRLLSRAIILLFILSNLFTNFSVCCHGLRVSL